MTNQWLISNDDLELIREALEAPTHEANSYNCQDWPPGTGCSDCEGTKLRQEVLSSLDSMIVAANEDLEKLLQYAQLPESGLSAHEARATVRDEK